MKKLLALLLICMAGAAYATVYVNQNSSGGIEYTDTPSDNSKKLDVPPVNSITTNRPAPVATTNNSKDVSTSPTGSGDAATSTETTYTSFDIASPKNEENIQNQATIAVEMRAEPNILAGDKIQLMLDEKPAGLASGVLYQELGFVERGKHTLYAIILNNQNQSIKKSPTITFFVHRNSSITSPAMQRPNQTNQQPRP
jgi:hypothetical protein